MTELRVNYLEHATDIFRHLDVLKSENAHTVFAEEGGPIAIRSNLVWTAMTASVDFYREARLEAEKIEHEASEWNLPFKLPTVDLTIAESAPYGFLGAGFRSTQ